MKNSSCCRICLLLLIALTPIFTYSQGSIPYGDNPVAGKYIQLNGVRHYYEAYGNGRALLLIHGNGTATKGWATQIEFFSKKYRVYSVDCRGRGKSDLGPDSLSFEQLAADMAAFIGIMQLDSVDIIGKSDGAIVAILMAIQHPAHIRRIVSFAANLQPDTTALHAETVAEIAQERRLADRMRATGDTTKNWLIEQQRYRLDEFGPHISIQDLHRIKVPVLVMSCDRDVIRLEHTLSIYNNIPLANLCILPGETHQLPRAHPELFIQIADRFLSQPFVPQAARFSH